MNEREKMLAGQLYDPADESLQTDRLRAKMCCFRISQLPSDQVDARNALFRELFGQSGTFHIEPPFRCDYGDNIKLGDNFFANYNCTILDCAEVAIGNNVMFAPNVSLFTAAHPLDSDKRNSGLEFALPITIGDNVWIGGNAVIMPNVCIGNNVVIGAGSIVTRDIPDNSIAAGNPCRVLRMLNDDDRHYYFKNREF
ncbi:sugar O-acetyltransferase [Muribacter muris]|uniref:Acetyltransferase n=1 Tax=Muribacter muris TaxID=67855 RepID=A0A4Y9K2G8_9PAST|nr:sugar O-acetyltransferase [Muribacter muris]MBF0784429.1 sugar O-acetyltransferase [Muribacter muris]MBF0827975.1 sugar O-acetyltransferase [Muribacter muris]TFV12203.1 sugar O-acetyltransferase [Muribacter muris]